MAEEVAREARRERANAKLRRPKSRDLERRVQMYEAPTAATAVRGGIVYKIKRASLCGRNEKRDMKPRHGMRRSRLLLRRAGVVSVMGMQRR